MANSRFRQEHHRSHIAFWSQIVRPFYWRLCIGNLDVRQCTGFTKSYIEVHTTEHTEITYTMDAPDTIWSNYVHFNIALPHSRSIENILTIFPTMCNTAMAVIKTISLPENKNMMTSRHGIFYRVTSLLWGEFTGHRWIPPTKDQ